MKQILFIIFLLFTVIFANVEKRMVEITFNELTELQQLVDMGIDLDHHRTRTEVHAFVTDEEFQMISQMHFGIREIPNKAKLYFEKKYRYFQRETNSNNVIDCIKYLKLTG